MVRLQAVTVLTPNRPSPAWLKVSWSPVPRPGARLPLLSKIAKKPYRSSQDITRASHRTLSLTSTIATLTFTSIIRTSSTQAQDTRSRKACRNASTLRICSRKLTKSWPRTRCCSLLNSPPRRRRAPLRLSLMRIRSRRSILVRDTIQAARE